MATLPRALRDLLAPLSIDEFVQEYWGKRSVFIKGRPDKFKGLFGLQDLFRLLADLPERPESVRIRAGNNHCEVSPNQARRLFESGLHLCIDELSTESRKLAAYEAAIRRQLGFAGKASLSCYLSPEGTGANDLHQDTRVATTLQLEGRKRWRYAAGPSNVWPARPAERPPKGIKLKQVVLEPGDVLCLPAGTWHAAEASKGYSLSFNLGLHALPFSVLLDDALVPLRQLPGWRMSPPLVPPRALAGGSLPAEVAEFFAERLAELRLAIDAMTPDTLALDKAWRHALLGSSPEVDAAPVPGGRSIIRKNDRFVVEPHSYVTTDSSHIVVILRGAELELEGDALLPLVQRLARTERFVAADVTHWGGRRDRYPWTAVKQVLGSLLDAGVIARSDV